MKVCKNCQSVNTNDCDFCINCGHSDFVFQEEVVCPHCGAANDVTAIFCINCGNRIHGPANGSVAPAGQYVGQPNEDGYTPVPVDLRTQMSEVYGGFSLSTPAETATCSVCGALVPIHAIYCQKCGSPTDKLHNHRVVRRKICPHCGRLNSLESQFCSYCFCSLQNAESQEMMVVHDTQNVGNEVVKQAYLENEHGKKKICTNCGALSPMDELFCVNCGLKLDYEEQKRYCPNCGAENPAENTFCIRCQWSFDGTAPNSLNNWVCAKCRTVNDGKNGFCTACGSPKDNVGRK